jgi:FtsH-binding integral membrane protein
MFPIWLILGLFLVLSGIFNKQLSRFLGVKPLSEVFTVPNLVQSSRVMEKLGRWLAITLGLSFLVQGLGTALPNDISSRISFLLLGLVGLMILIMIGLTIVKWKAK